MTPIIHRILTALEHPSHLTVEELKAVDSLHLQGRPATLELLSHVPTASRVLDVGCGVGGSSRVIAAAWPECRVTGIDPDPDAIDAAEQLTALCGLHDRMDFHIGSATDLPFDDGSFDGVWIQHVGMAVLDYPRMQAELTRVLVPGGWVAFHEVVATASPFDRFPTPWARSADKSNLVPAGRWAWEGFERKFWADKTAETLIWAQRLRPATELGPWLIVGPDFTEKFGNVRLGLESGELGVQMGVLIKPA